MTTINPATVPHTHPHGPLCSPQWCGGGNRPGERPACTSPDHAREIELYGCCDVCGTFASQEQLANAGCSTVALAGTCTCDR